MCHKTNEFWNTEDMKDLRKLNFERLISVDVPDVESYTYDE